MKTLPTFYWRIAATLFCWTVAASAALAQDFRVDTEVFIGDQKEPVAETLTIFHGGRVYDFLLTGSKEITIYDPRRGQFSLLDVERKLKSSVTTQELLDHAEKINEAVEKENDPFLTAVARPQFEQQIEPFQERGQDLVRITLTSKEIIYRAVGKKPDQPAAVQAYRQFTDYFARFNAARPGNLPPGARLALNKVLAEQELIPVSVERIITTPGPLGKKLEVRSKHLINWIIAGEDEKKISHAGDCLARFEAIEFEKHRQMDAKLPTASPATASTNRR